VKLATRLNLAPKWRGAVSLLHHMPSWHAQGRLYYYLAILSVGHFVFLVCCPLLMKTADLLRFLCCLYGSPRFNFMKHLTDFNESNISLLYHRPHTFQLLQSAVRAWRKHGRVRQQLNVGKYTNYVNVILFWNAKQNDHCVKSGPEFKSSFDGGNE